MKRKELQKIDRSISLLKSFGSKEPIEVAYSGGKDSDVILQLVKEAGIPYKAYYKNTTIDPPGTIKHCLENNVEIKRPQKTFFHLIEEAGFPNIHYRFCCNVLKEYKILDKVVIGVRKSESVARNKRYNEPTECRYYGKKIPQNHIEAIYPILDWTDEDVVDFINDRKIKLHPLYYRSDGTIDPSRRLGCMCCPLQYEKKRQRAFAQHPQMIRAYLRAGQKYLDTHPNHKRAQIYNNAYEWLVRDLFFRYNEDWNNFINVPIFGRTDCKRTLEEFFNIKLDGISKKSRYT